MIIKRNDLLPQIKALYAKYGATMKEINIGGIGDDTCQDQDIFNDYFWLNMGVNLWFWKGTTNPGKSTTETKEGGAAHVCYGHHEKIWVIDTHAANNPSFAHKALCQREEKGCLPIKIYRDVNKDYIYTTDKDKIESGYFGINFHRASATKDVEKIGGYSAGCCVTLSIKDFNFIMNTIEQKCIELKNMKYLFNYLLVPKAEITFNIEA